MLTAGLRVCLLVVGLGVAGFRPASASGCQLSLAATLPVTFAAHGSKLLIDVVANGAKLTMMLDTGAENIMLNGSAGARVGGSPSAGGRIGDEQTRIGYAEGIGGSRVVTPIEIDNLALGRVHGAFGATITGKDFTLSDHAVDGLLGMSVLGNFDIDMDLPGQQVRLFRADGACSQPAVSLDQPLYAVPMRDSYHSQVRIMIPVTINGHGFTALLDSGAPGTLIYAHAAAELGLIANPAMAGRHLMATGVGGKSAIFLSTVDSLAVGPLTLRHVPVAVDSENGGESDLLLGLSFMKRVHVWISNSSHTLVMQYPPVASPTLQLGP